MRLTQQTPKSIYPRTVNYWCICICLPTEKHLHVWLGQNKPCGFSDEDTQNSKNLYLCMRCVCLCVWNLEYRLRQRGEGCEQCIEVPLKKNRRNLASGNLSMHKRRMPALHFIHQWWKCNHALAGWSRTEEVFQDTAVMKNEWLFATNTVAPESFMGHVMEKYDTTNDKENPLPNKHPWNNKIWGIDVNMWRHILWFTMFSYMSQENIHRYISSKMLLVDAYHLLYMSSSTVKYLKIPG